MKSRLFTTVVVMLALSITAALRYKRMFKTLYFKLAAVLGGIFCLIGVLYILLTLYTTQMYF